ncbi:hypothetical protein JYQ62_25575 [Nostoc sp. UHCC 0702]|nr:hypothetical protein JYQ62_25575 [Nostoc sp. UHCC 0702]
MVLKQIIFYKSDTNPIATTKKRSLTSRELDSTKSDRLNYAESAKQLVNS